MISNPSDFERFIEKYLRENLSIKIESDKHKFSTVANIKVALSLNGRELSVSRTSIDVETN